MTTLILFFHLFFGLWFVYQTYTSKSGRMFSNTVIKSCIFGYLLILSCTAKFGVFAFICGIYLPIFIFIATEYIFLYQRLYKFQSQFLILLDSIIARMKMGHSFREALNKGIEAIESKWMREDLTELKDRVIYSQKAKSQQAKEFLFAFQTFKQADQDPQPLDRLRYIRQTLKTEEIFRKKSGNTLFQIRLQSSILTLFYIGTFIFTSLYYGNQFLTLMIFSLALFAAGSILVFILGRRIKWTL